MNYCCTHIRWMQKSEHPLAKAVLKCGQESNLTSIEPQEFMALPGNGLSAMCDGEKRDRWQSEVH